jgi:hypothetical protein
MTEEMTRDPERIGPMLDLLGALWREHPNLRLGQLVCNVAVAADPRTPRATEALGANAGMLSIDPFSVEDDAMAAGLLAMTSQRRKVGAELARALGIDAATLPQAPEFRVPRYYTPDDA